VLHHSSGSVLLAADALSEEAPLPRLRAALLSVAIARPDRWPSSGVGLRDLAAGFVAGLLASGGADTPNHAEKRGDLALSSWSHSGRGYLVIGRLPEEQVAELAETLKVRF
jgi:anti-sigma factor RsiW